MKILIYLDENALSPAGGPLGVGYYIHEEVVRRGLTKQIHFLRSNPDKKRREDWLKTILHKSPKLTAVERSLRRMIEYHTMFYHPRKEAGVFKDYDAIHFHSTMDMYKQRRNLREYTGHVLLTSHSPIPLAEELYGASSTAFEKRYVKKRMALLKKMDRWSFSHADYIVFPCPEAEEPYRNNWPAYDRIAEKRKAHFRYVPTGISLKTPSISRKEIREQLGVGSRNFMIAYVGRHNEVKGYGNLKKLGKAILDKSPDIRMLIAGEEGPLMRLKHPSWIEIGYTLDPYSYIAASDVFLLPNKETYFDLVMIEVLSLGKLVIASRTGGNKYFERMGLRGVFLYDTLEEAEALIYKVKMMSGDRRRRLERENKEFYRRYLSGERFFDSYINMLSSIGLSMDK